MELELLHKDGTQRFFMSKNFGLIAIDFNDPIRRWYVVDEEGKNYKIDRWKFLASPVNNDYLNEEFNKLYKECYQRNYTTK